MVDDWKSDLRERLIGLSVEEPDGLREAVMGSLGKKKRRRTVLVWMAPAMAAAAAIALVFLPGKPSSPVMKEDVSPVAEMAPEASAGAVIARNDTDRTDTGRGSGLRKDKVRERTSVLSFNPSTDIPDTLAETVKEEPVRESEAVMESDVEKETGSGAKRQEEDRIIQENIYFRDAEKRAGRFRAAVGLLASASGVKSTTINSYGINRNLATKGMIGSGGSVYGSDAQPSGVMPVSMLLATANAPTESTVRHRMPVNVGAMLSIGIAPKLYAETGVIYSALHSEFSSGNRSGSYVSTQDMGYIGVPLGLRYNIVENRRLDVYVSCDGVMRKPVSFSRVTVSYIDGKPVSRVDESDVDYDYLQWSAVASAGVQFNITNWMGIYAEPGFAWHFQSKSPVVNIYSDRQADFNLNFGLRFRI